MSAVFNYFYHRYNNSISQTQKQTGAENKKYEECEIIV